MVELLAIYFIWLCFYPLCSKRNSLGQCLWVKQYYDAIHSSLNMKMAYFTAWHSPRKFQYEYLRFLFMLMKTKHPVRIMVFGVVTSDDDIVLPSSHMTSHRDLSHETGRKFGLILFTNPSARAGYDTRSIFKWSLTGLNSEFSFS